MYPGIPEGHHLHGSFTIPQILLSHPYLGMWHSHGWFTISKPLLEISEPNMRLIYIFTQAPHYTNSFEVSMVIYIFEILSLDNFANTSRLPLICKTQYADVIHWPSNFIDHKSINWLPTDHQSRRPLLMAGILFGMWNLCSRLL